MGKGRQERKDNNRQKVVQKIIDRQKKAQAVHYDEQEKQEIIEGKKREFVHLQRQYRSEYLNLRQLHVELEIMKKQLKEGPITFKWEGITCPNELLAIWHDKKVNQYAEIVASFKMTEQRLLKYGLTVDEIETLQTNAKYIKEMPEEHKDEHKKSTKPDYVG